MKGYKAILEELCRTAYNLPAGELQELISKPEEELTEDESKDIAEKLKKRHRDVITSINKTAELKLDDKFKAGQRSKAQEFEKVLKEKFGVDSDKEGSELIDDISSQLAEKAKGKNKSDLTDDDVKKHAAFIRMETEYKKQLKDLKDNHDTELTNLKKEAGKKEVFSTVSKKALELFEAMNPVLSDDPKKAAAQKELILDKLSGYDFEIVEGKIIVYKDGKVAENEFGHKIEFDDLVKTTATNYFDFKVAEERKAPNAGGGETGDDDEKKTQPYTGKFPKTQAEYQTMMNDDKISIKDRMAINDHWAKQTAEQ